MKRLTYISKFADNLTPEDIEKIGEVSRRNNARNNITGILLCSGGIFFQILEGGAEEVDQLYEKIIHDPRHKDIVCLKTETNTTTRMFPKWSMQVTDLDQNMDILVVPIKAMLNAITESRMTLEKYTQPSILKIIQKGINPLQVEPQKVERIILFCDLMSFSRLTEKLPVQEVIAMVNKFLTICTTIIDRKGGEVTKYIGDCVMAYFDSNQGDAALQASLDILAEMKKIRLHESPESPWKFMYVGIGISKGTVIEGNIGSALKKDYTIIGDAVNTAERLESLTRNLPYFLAFSADVKASCHEDWQFTEVGKVKPKGKDKKLNVYSVDHPLSRKKQPHAFSKQLTNGLKNLKSS